MKQNKMVAMIGFLLVLLAGAINEGDFCKIVFGLGIGFCFPWAVREVELLFRKQKSLKISINGNVKPEKFTDEEIDFVKERWKEHYQSKLDIATGNDKSKSDILKENFEKVIDEYLDNQFAEAAHQKKSN